MELRCAQKGCTFEADEAPENCPVCNNPFVENLEPIEVEATWDDYTIAELREQATDWEVEGWNSRTTKAELIELLEVVEAEIDADEKKSAEETDYADFDLDELRAIATEAELADWDDSTTQEELIERLEAADAESDDDDD